MVLTIEPSLALPASGGHGRRLMVHEENIVVTAAGLQDPDAPRPARAARR